MLGFSVLEGGRRLSVKARAKVNLGLEVLGPRPDGYHELLTLLAAIDLADRVTLETTGREAIEVACDAAGVPGGPENLAWRAADLVRREAQVAGGVRIRIEKAIPVAAGLGGGSADAAAVIAGLERLWGVALTPKRRHEIATALGMDVPFFLGEGPALASGRGEVVTPVGALRPLALVVVNPGFPLATREVYGRLGPHDFGSGRAVRALLAALAEGPRAIAARLVNDLERAVGPVWPGLDEVKAALVSAGALGAVMSGSGPTVVGVAQSLVAARRIRASLAERPWRAWVTRTVNGPAVSLGGPRGARPAGGAVTSWGVAKR
jgi:4-diphosphocytidyl-2-C-methyl-D-erythritol kinase